VAEIYTGLSKELHLFRRRGLLIRNDSLVLSNGEHVKIIEALRNHSCELSERTMTDHILAGKARLLQRVREQGSEGSEAGLDTTKERE
jgi:DNA-binding GntR family transcriptional regulator